MSYIIPQCSLVDGYKPKPPHAVKQLGHQVTTYMIAQCHNPEHHSQNLTKTTYKLQEE